MRGCKGCELPGQIKLPKAQFKASAASVARESLRQNCSEPSGVKEAERRLCRIDRPDQITTTPRKAFDTPGSVLVGVHVATECEVVRAGVRGQHFVRVLKKKKEKYDGRNSERNRQSGRGERFSGQALGRSDSALAGALQYRQRPNPKGDDYGI